ncbi:TPA: hypothetical protein ACPKAL_004994 [Vibrio alginolyticus]|nr:hypothetical protein [Vibrio alginolyticus]MDM4737516.1 hypothetical protein [Vibrio alginolyticus]MDM4757863.1 hypothetical protein [Vibrio alginolyticus]
MTPFVLNEDDEAIITTCWEKVSPNEKWAEPAVTELKARMKHIT